MAAAVLVGLANATLYSLIGNNTFDNLFEWQRDPWFLYMLYAFCGVFVGLLVSAGLIKLAEDVLYDSYFARYGLMVVAVCIGGAVLAVYLTTITYLFDDNAMVPQRISEVFYMLAMVTVPGAMLGAIEGVVLASPLAWLLGLFKKQGTEI